jgi:DNA invertase Pin-like site-specific DNA recombinase
MNKIYGYARISKRKQSIERQIRNITTAYPEVSKIYQEAFTGTKQQERKEFQNLIKNIKAGDTIVFDSVSRMSRNADEGLETYMELYNKGVELVFLKEPQINTSVYKESFKPCLSFTGDEIADLFIKATNKAINILAKKQIKIAFEQAEKEVKDLQQRTREGIETARLSGKQIGQKEGAKLTTKKSIAAKEIILKHNKSFNGTLNDKETAKLANISINTLYKYKRELRAEQL